MRRRFSFVIVALLAACSATPTEAPRPQLVPPPSASISAAPLPTVPAVPPPSARVPSGWPHGIDAPPTVSARFMVVSDAPLATRVGVSVLEQGGNAVDAAVAVAFALAVVYPEAGNIGGGGFALVKSAGGSFSALDFRETAPLKATHDMFLNKDGKPALLRGPDKKTLLDEDGTPLMASRAGALSAGVPGSVAGLYSLHQKLGSKPWKELVQPAIDLANKGFTVDDAYRHGVSDAAGVLRHFPSSKELFLPQAKPPELGETVKNPDLGATLERIADKGADGFYKGRTAELIEAQMKKSGGLIRKEDLSSYQAKWRDPIVFRYHGHTIASMPPPSSGGLTMALIGGILDKDPIRALGWHSSKHLHLEAEAMRRAFADRNELFGDPDFVKMPLSELLSPSYAKKRRESIGERATPSSEIKAAPPIPDGDHTTHFGVVDDKGNAVALTTTINALCGSGLTVGGAGFLLNDEMDDFTVKPGEPNMFGLVQGEANAIAPQKRMLSSMSPTIVLDGEGKIKVVAGARGGSRIISATWQVISNVIDFDMDVSAAVRAPRVHQQHLPDELFFEKDGLEGQELGTLEALGYRMKPVANIAAAPAIVRRADGMWTAAPDPRRGGSAEGR